MPRSLPRRPIKRRQVLPRQIPPKLVETDYAGHLIKRIIRPARAAYAPLLGAVRQAVAEAHAEQAVKRDSRKDDVEAGIRGLLREGAKKLGHAVSQSGLAALAERYARETSEYQKAQLHRQVSKVLGTDPLLNDARLSSRIRTFIDHNVSLVTRIPQALHDDLADMIDQGAQEGWLIPDMVEEMADRFGISERHARLVARDQIGSLYADVNHDRQRSLGVTSFIWRTAGDERVRGDPDGLYPKAEPSHFDLDGHMFDYDDPPIDLNGESFLPGDQIQCRCYAEPVLDDILDDLDDDGESEDGDQDQDPESEDDFASDDGES